MPQECPHQNERRRAMYKTAQSERCFPMKQRRRPPAFRISQSKARIGKDRKAYHDQPVLPAQRTGHPFRDFPGYGERTHLRWVAAFMDQVERVVNDHKSDGQTDQPQINNANPKQKRKICRRRYVHRA